MFPVCPTVDMNDEFNMSLEDADTKAGFLGALNMECGLYEDTARLYAPYYRQAAMKVYALEPSEREPWLALAYGDVSAAFAHYLAHENEGRPIILAGFSQGADMCYRLLEEYFGDEALYSRLVAVYAIGWPCTQEMTAQYPPIVPGLPEGAYHIYDYQFFFRIALHRVTARDIDMARHMNNVAYVRAIVDAYPLRVWENMRVREMTVVFLASATEGEELRLQRRVRGPETDMLISGADGRKVALARLILEQP